MIIPFGFLKQPSSGGAATIFDDLSAAWLLYRPDMTTLWTNAVLKIRRSSDNATAYLFFDGDLADDTVSLASFISTTSATTPDATTLSTWVGLNSAFVDTQYAITTNNTISSTINVVQTTTGTQPKFVESGVIETENGKPAISYVSTDVLLSSGSLSALDAGNSFTIIVVAQDDTANGVGVVFSTLDIAAGVSDRFVILIDRRTNKLINIIKNSSSVQVSNVYASQIDTSNQRLLSTMVTASTLDVFYNGTDTDSLSWSGTYRNEVIKFGAQQSNATPLTGTIQAVYIFPSDKTADLTALHSNINSFFTIY